MGRLGAFVVVGALIAPLGGTVAADTSGAPPLSIAKASPAFFDLGGWYARVAAGTLRSSKANLGASAAALPTVDGSYWSVGWLAAAAHNRAIARTTFDQTTFEKLTAHNVRFGTRWSSNDAAIAK